MFRQAFPKSARRIQRRPAQHAPTPVLRPMLMRKPALSSTRHPTKSSANEQASYDKNYPPLTKFYPSKRSNHTAAGVAATQARNVRAKNHAPAPHAPAPASIDSRFEDIERPMLKRIKALEDRFAVEDPERRVRDVEATGSCFFFCGNLALQDLGHKPWTNSDAQLREAADTDRLDVYALMLDQLDMPMRDGDTFEKKADLAALEPFPGPPTTHVHACPRHADCEFSRTSGADGTARSYLEYIGDPNGWADGLAIAVWQVCCLCGTARGQIVAHAALPPCRNASRCACACELI